MCLVEALEGEFNGIVVTESLAYGVDNQREIIVAAVGQRVAVLVVMNAQLVGRSACRIRVLPCTDEAPRVLGWVALRFGEDMQVDEFTLLPLADEVDRIIDRCLCFLCQIMQHFHAFQFIDAGTSLTIRGETAQHSANGIGHETFKLVGDIVDGAVVSLDGDVHGTVNAHHHHLCDEGGVGGAVLVVAARGEQAHRGE